MDQHRLLGMCGWQNEMLDIPHLSIEVERLDYPTQANSIMVCSNQIFEVFESTKIITCIYQYIINIIGIGKLFMVAT